MGSRKEYLAQRYISNRAKVLAKAREYRIANPDVRKSWLKKNGSKPKVRFDKAYHDAVKRRKKKWDLTVDQYTELIKNKCNYCEADISNDRGCGLDRLNNDMGYEIGNVVACCGVCNSGRNRNFTPDEWKVGIKAILEFRKNMGQKC